VQAPCCGVAPVESAGQWMAVQFGLAEACAEAASALEHVVPVLSPVYRHFRHFSPSSSNFQAKNKQLFSVCISDASMNKAHTNYCLPRSRLPPGFLFPNPYLAG